MYKKWEDIKKTYPNHWVCLKEYRHQDKEGQILDGGVVFATAVTQEDLYEQIGSPSINLAIHHTREDDDNGDTLFNYKYR